MKTLFHYLQRKVVYPSTGLQNIFKYMYFTQRDGSSINENVVIVYENNVATTK